MKRWILPALCGIAALALLLYPLVSEAVNRKYHSNIETAYTAAIEGADTAELEQQREAARQYSILKFVVCFNKRRTKGGQWEI